MVFEKIRKNLSGRPIKNLQRWGEENIRDFGIRGDFGNSWGFIWDFFLIFGISGILALGNTLGLRGVFIEWYL